MMSGRRGSMGPGSLPKMRDEFGQRSHSITESMIRSIVDKVHAKLGKDKKRLLHVQVILPDGEKRMVRGRQGTLLSEFLSDVAMEYQLSSYQVFLASSKAMLNLDMEADLVDNSTILIEDANEGDMGHSSDSRFHTMKQLLRSERMYQEALRSIFDSYAEPLRKFSSLSVEDHKILFFGIEPLLSLSARLCVKLEECSKSWDPGSTTIGNLFNKKFFSWYEDYYPIYEQICGLLHQKQESDEEFVQFCLLRRGSTSHSLEHLLFLPVQRIPAYEGFLQDLLAETGETHPDYEDLTKATKTLTAMVKQHEGESGILGNDHKMDSVQDRFPHDDLQLNDKDKARWKSLQARRRSAPPGAMLLRTLSKKSPISSGNSGGLLPDLANATRGPNSPPSSRMYMLEGSVQLTAGLQTQERYLFLFNDVLLVAKQKSTQTFKLKNRVRVCEMWLSSVGLDEVTETTRCPDTSFVMGWPTTNTVLSFPNQDTRDLWYHKLTQCVQEEKNKEEPKTVVIKILNKDMKEFANSKCLTVTNDEDAQDVVRRCMEDFHIMEGEPKDYQLWVLSGKEDSPYPLIGHEHPYSIKMSHVRDVAKVSRDDMALPIDIDANDATIQCQFILRQTKKAPNKLSHDENSRKAHKKNKKSPLMSFFKKSLSKLDNSPPISPALGKLFGHLLTDLSQDESFPRPVMDILYQLFVNGPYTNGIFRRSANARVCRELREKLDGGEEVCMEEVPVLVLSATLKDFLRSMPDCLLLSELYEQFADTLEVAVTQERVTTVLRIFEEMPRCNVNLLRHIMCVLWHIDKRCEENQMNAYNLAICISQSLLWPSLSLGPTVQTHASKKVPMFVQFLIENCTEVFGAECPMLFGEPVAPKPRQDSSTDSDSLHSLLSLPEHTGLARRDDSSIDSLERYSSEMESSPRLLKSHLSATNLSRDSGLTLSDTQLYNDEESELTPRRTTHSLARSVSQMEENKMNIDPGTLSRSCEGTLNIDPTPPVPPPRRQRRKVMEVGMGQALAIPQGSRNTIMRHAQSMGQVSELRRQNLRFIHNTKRVSNDSLGSLEEYAETGEMSDSYPDLQDRGLLRKSESGAHLYMDDDLLLGGYSPQEGQPAHPTITHHSSLKRKKEQSSDVASKHIPTRHSWGEMLADDAYIPDLSATYHDGQGASPVEVQMDFSASYSSPGSFSKLQFHLSPSPPSSPLTAPKHQSLKVSQVPPPPSTYTSGQSYNGNNNNYARESRSSVGSSFDSSDMIISEDETPVRPHKSMDLDQVDHDVTLRAHSPPPKSLLRTASSDPRKVRAGMTASGGDFFPKHMRSILRQSLHGEEVIDAVPTSSTCDNDLDHRSQTADRKHVSRSESLKKERHAEQRRPLVEKSASDTHVAQKLSSETHGVERRRPDKPPSYQEALHRKSLLKSGMPLYDITEQDAIQQRSNSDKARLLYEQSMKQYQEQATLETPDDHDNLIARKKAAKQEAARQELLRQEMLRQETARQEALRQEAARREDAARQEVARKEAARQEAALKEAARREEIARQEADRKEAARKEVARQEAARQEAARQEAARQEAAKREEALMAEAGRQEALRQEVKRKEEAARQEAARQEAARQEAARQEAARQEAARLEVTKQAEDAAHVEAERQERKEEATQQESARREAVKRELDKHEATQREEASQIESLKEELSRQEMLHREKALQLESNRREEVARLEAERQEHIRLEILKLEPDLRQEATRQELSRRDEAARQESARREEASRMEKFRREESLQSIEAATRLEAAQQEILHKEATRQEEAIQRVVDQAAKHKDQFVVPQNRSPSERTPKGHRDHSSDRSRSSVERSPRSMAEHNRKISEERRLGHNLRVSDEQPSLKRRESQERRKDNHNRESPSRSSHSRERTPNRDSSERSRKNNKSRERGRNQRLSDTRLENNRNKDMNGEFRNARSSNLIRSKSDSSEHINKLGKFKELKPLDNNVLDRRKSASRIERSEPINIKDSVRSERRKSVNSVRNKDWHKELADKYSKVFYQPTEVQTAIPQYAYVKHTKTESMKDNEKPRRRWTPPVHPSRDLVITSVHPNDILQAARDQRQRRHSPVKAPNWSELQHIQVERIDNQNDNHRREPSPLRNGNNNYRTESNNNNVAEKENWPRRETSGENTTNHHQVEPQHSDEEFTTAEPVEISWSVARLRNLYDEQKAPPPPYKNPPPMNKSEKSGEESYV